MTGGDKNILQWEENDIECMKIPTGDYYHNLKTKEEKISPPPGFEPWSPGT